MWWMAWCTTASPTCPAAVPNTSTQALTNATFPYVLKLANHGAKAAIQSDPGIAEGVNTYAGTLTYKAVAESQNRDWKRSQTCCNRCESAAGESLPGG